MRRLEVLALDAEMPRIQLPVPIDETISSGLGACFVEAAVDEQAAAEDEPRDLSRGHGLSAHWATPAGLDPAVAKGRGASFAPPWESPLLPRAAEAS
jgi:hypothetical protein